MQKRIKRTDPLPTYIFGTHAVTAALTNAPHSIVRVLRARSMRDQSLVAKVKKLGLQLVEFDAKTPPKGIAPDDTHQGIVAEIMPSKILTTYREFLDTLTVSEDTALVLLGEVQDPQNVGAIIRSAAAFGAAGVLIPEHRQAPVTGTVVKVSAGTAFTIPLVSIGNVNTTLRDLQDRGFWVYGLLGEGDTNLGQEDFSKPSVFVVGNEAEGLRDKTREVCDFALSIPIHPRVESLNAATALSVALYQWSVRHPHVAKP